MRVQFGKAFYSLVKKNLNNLTVIVDKNNWRATGRSSEILDLNKLEKN